MAGLKVSHVVWSRIPRFLATVCFFGAIFGGIAYAIVGEKLILNAEGFITQDKVVIALPYDARLRQVFVRPGDRVEAGQAIASVESAALSKTLADISGKRAKLLVRNSQIEGRIKVVELLLPIAEEHSKVVSEYLANITAAKLKGLMIDRTIQEISSLMLANEERKLGLLSERTSLDFELKANKQALAELDVTYDDLKNIFEQGVLRAPVAGIIDATVSSIGEMMTPGSSKVTQIYTGIPYALAYLPENYLFELAEGQQVSIKGRGRTTTAYIKQILPVTQELPAEFQNPNHSRSRGQMIKIELEEASLFPVNQKIKVTNCYSIICSRNRTLDKLGLERVVLAP
jgi:multidrug resistance efflux pump